MAPLTWWRLLALAGVVLGGAGCGGYQEILRLPSPDGRVDAVVVEVEAGAGNPFVYRVYLVARGGTWQQGHERLAYVNPLRFRVAWRDARHLELCYDDARFLSDTERAASGASQSPEDLVEIERVTPTSKCRAPVPERSPTG